MLYPQNGDRIVTIDSVTSLQPMYNYSLRFANHFAVFMTQSGKTVFCEGWGVFGRTVFKQNDI